jgi:hypothetical protein
VKFLFQRKDSRCFAAYSSFYAMPEEEAEMDVEEGEDVVGEEEAEELVEEGEAEELGGEEEGDEGEYDYFDDIMDDREEAMKQHRKR